MLLTEYDEEKTLLAEYYAGERAGLAEGETIGTLRTTCELVASGDLPLDVAIRKLSSLGIVNETDLRNKAQQLGINI